MTATVDPGIDALGCSVADAIAALDDDAIRAWIDSLPDEVVAEVARREWWFVSRPDQRQPAGDWAIWLILAGRGWGKTRTGAEWLTDRVVENPVDVDGHPTEWAAVAEHIQDARKILIDGPSGLRNVLNRRGIRYEYTRWPAPLITLHTGQVIHILGAHDKDTGRGLNLAGAWLDEIAKWPYPTESWTEGLAPALRTKTPGNAKPRVVVTTTPKPIPLLFDWHKRDDGSVHITRGSTFDNAANLSASAIAEFVRLYGNSRIGRQELYAELLEDVEGALWHLRWIEAGRLNPKRLYRIPDPAEHGTPARVKLAEWIKDLVKIVVAVDPAVTVTETSDETGLLCVGRGRDGHEYVLDDRSKKVAGREAAREAWLLWRHWSADELVYESNQGANWVRDVLVDQWNLLQAENPPCACGEDHGPWPAGDAPVIGVNARRGKKLRAEPIAARYENIPPRVHHLGVFPALESQMTEWLPDSGDSPDRLDALVHGLTRLRGTEAAHGTVTSPAAPAEPQGPPATTPVDPAAALVERVRAQPAGNRIRRR